MEQQDRPAPPPAAADADRIDGDRLLARYGDLLEEESDAARKRELLLALWRILQGFVDLGFSVKPGAPIGPGATFGVDHVLQHILDTPEPDRLGPRFEAAGREDRE
ncbi:hypothetical protein [Albimonas pacifica]|uniref:Uncharacterized protein n=1 Tax=Albimonas pacifica TaxID=1114924 RepID=A0A1I3P0B5_9RHOB|nr:hypothetical protein [Albimonas pacifica]SFJ14889.1 hypothetical protein SAMN05216258_11511 [Albimonas pacifica]